MKNTTNVENMVNVDSGKIKTQNWMYFFFWKKKKAIQKEYKLSFCNWNNATLILPCSKSIWEFITGRTLKCHKVTASKFAKACALHTLCGILFTLSIILHTGVKLFIIYICMYVCIYVVEDIHKYINIHINVCCLFLFIISFGKLKWKLFKLSIYTCGHFPPNIKCVKQWRNENYSQEKHFR